MERAVKETTANQYLKRVNTLKKKLGLTFERVDQMFKYIKQFETEIEKYKSSETKRAYYSALLYYYRLLKPESPNIQKYLNILQKYRNELTIKYNKQETPYVPLQSIVNLRNSLYDDLLKDPKNNKLNMLVMTLCMNTMYPPMRNNLYKLPISNIETISRVYKKNGNWHISINDEHKGKLRIVNEKFDEPLSKFIDLSLKFYPRKYLISDPDDPNEPMDEQQISNVLSNFDPPLGINVFRHAYITDFYSKVQGLNARQKLANKMLHSVSTADQIYNGINAPQNKKQSNKLPDVFKPIKKLKKIPTEQKHDENILHTNIIQKTIDAQKNLTKKTNKNETTVAPRFMNVNVAQNVPAVPVAIPAVAKKQKTPGEAQKEAMKKWRAKNREKLAAAERERRKNKK